MKRLHRIIFVLSTLLLVFTRVLLAQSTPQITAAEIAKHIRYLASDQLEGRKSGSMGAEAAAQYIANEFRSYGLKPIGDYGSYFQNFDFVAGVKLGVANSLSFYIAGNTVMATVNKDYRPLGFSSSDTFEGGIVFVGYGISDTAKKYDDYAGVDVRGMAVMVLRNAPPSDSTKDLGQYFESARARSKGAHGYDRAGGLRHG